MLFSICIPNYNYGRYLGQTIQSVLSQHGVELELLISDNASTDDSVEVVKAFADARIRLSINTCNVGFAGNLDRVAGMASGDFMVMLSSDDVMQPNALHKYQSFLLELGPAAKQVVLSSTLDVIDSEGVKTGTQGPDCQLWTAADRSPRLESGAKCPIYAVTGADLLNRCLRRLRNPFNFASTCYPRALYQKVAGYGANRLINPDKWFHWKLLSVADMAYFVDFPLFSYRWHPANQSALESNSGSLKFLIDEYTSTLELDAQLLQRLLLSREAIIRAFLDTDIINHGLATLARGGTARARRILRFGEAVYPDQLKTIKRHWLLRGLLWLGPLGKHLANIAYARYGPEATALSSRNGYSN